MSQNGGSIPIVEMRIRAMGEHITSAIALQAEGAGGDAVRDLAAGVGKAALDKILKAL